MVQCLVGRRRTLHGLHHLLQCTHQQPGRHAAVQAHARAGLISPRMEQLQPQAVGPGREAGRQLQAQHVAAADAALPQHVAVLQLADAAGVQAAALRCCSGHDGVVAVTQRLLDVCGCGAGRQPHAEPTVHCLLPAGQQHLQEELLSALISCLAAAVCRLNLHGCIWPCLCSCG